MYVHFKFCTLSRIKSRLEKNGFKLFQNNNLTLKSIYVQFSTISVIMKKVSVTISPNLIGFILIT